MSDERMRKFPALDILCCYLYFRTYLFGPGTHCRCATCTALPRDCAWGGGPYAGTLLLYAQVQHVVYMVQYRRRCATCTALPPDCAWAGGGPYAGTLLLYAQVQHAVYVVQYRMRYATCTTLPGDCAWAVGGPYAGTLLLYAQVQHAVYCWYSIRGNVPPVPPFLVTVPGVGEDPMLLYALVQHAVYVVQYCIGGDMPPLPLNPVTVPGVGGTCMVGWSDLVFFHIRYIFRSYCKCLKNGNLGRMCVKVFIFLGIIGTSKINIL